MTSATDSSPLWDDEGNPIYESEMERLLDELTRTGRTEIKSEGFVTEIKFDD